MTLLGLTNEASKLDDNRYFIVFNIFNASLDKISSTTINAIPRIKGLSSTSIKPTTLNTGAVQVSTFYGYNNHTMIYNVEKIEGKSFYEFEFSTCNGEMQVTIAESNDIYEVFSEAKYSHQSIVSMKNSFISVESQKNLYVYVNGIKGDPKRTCKQNAYQADCSKEGSWVEYSFIYTILNSDQNNEEAIEDEGIIKIGDSGIGNSLSLSWKPIQFFNKSTYTYDFSSNITYYIYAVDNEYFFSKMQSTCFLITLKPTYVIKSEKKVSEYTKLISKSYKKPVYINILAHNTETGESYAYIPTKIYISYSSHIMFIFISILVTIVVLGIAFTCYRKFRKARHDLSIQITNNSIHSKLTDEIHEDVKAHKSNQHESIAENNKTSTYIELEAQ